VKCDKNKLLRYAVSSILTCNFLGIQLAQMSIVCFKIRGTRFEEKPPASSLSTWVEILSGAPTNGNLYAFLAAFLSARLNKYRALWDYAKDARFK